MIRNDGRDFSGTHEKFIFEIKKNYSFNPKLRDHKNILNRTLENDEIDFYIKNTHRRSIKLGIKFFYNHFKLI